MKARRLIGGATLGPAALKALGEAFDVAWASIADSVGTDPLTVESARLELADILLSIADDHSRDAKLLRDAVLRIYNT
jgi:hypothetical protein